VEIKFIYFDDIVRAVGNKMLPIKQHIEAMILDKGDLKDKSPRRICESLLMQLYYKMLFTEIQVFPKYPITLNNTILAPPDPNIFVMFLPFTRDNTNQYRDKMEKLYEYIINLTNFYHKAVMGLDFGRKIIVDEGYRPLLLTNFKTEVSDEDEGYEYKNENIDFYTVDGKLVPKYLQRRDFYHHFIVKFLDIILKNDDNISVA